MVLFYVGDLGHDSWDRPPEVQGGIANDIDAIIPEGRVGRGTGQACRLLSGKSLALYREYAGQVELE